MNTPSPIRLLTDAELHRLDALLEAAAPDDSMMLEELDGFFAALACSPLPVRQDEYFAVALGAEPGEAPPTPALNPAEARELTALLELHRQAVASQLFDGDGYAPVLGYDEAGEAQGNAWAIGFVRGMALRPAAWDALDDDEQASDALEPLMRLVREVEPDDEFPEAPVSDAERGPLLEAMFDGVMDVYAYFRETRERNLAPATVRNPVKAGRNDPCPCGSGRKFKVCCGAPPAVH